MSELQGVRQKHRGELEAPPAWRWFGASDLPRDKWPEGYGSGGQPSPLGCFKPFKYPLQQKRAAE